METGLPTDGRMGGHTPAFLKAVEHYGQHGRNKKLPKDVKAALEGDHPTTHYIWRTAGDKNVRPEHAENEGKIFAWSNPPKTGHPGADYGCRCQAEPYWPKSYMEKQEPGNVRLIIILGLFRNILKAGGKWTNIHFVAHFYVGGGRPVTLKKIGHLDDVQDYYSKHYLKRFHDQLIDKAPAEDGLYTNEFSAAYDFEDVKFSHGDSTIRGKFKGKVYTRRFGERLYEGNTAFHFHDVFTDPLDIVTVIKALLPGETDVWQWVKDLADTGGLAYEINDSWEWRMRGYIRKEDNL
jgi:hypothetical protein